LHVNQHGTNAEYLLGFLATHACFSLFFLHMPIAFQKHLVLFGEFLPGKKGWHQEMCRTNLGLKCTLKKKLDLDFGFHLSLELERKLGIF
jgi:hypothetical protein